MFGDDVPVASQHFISRWGQDPHTLGTYSYDRPHFFGHAWRERLRDPIGDNRLFFAGEATRVQDYGTAYGALLSGELMAKQLSDRLKAQTRPRIHSTTA